jgi:hypothetical protein
VEIGIVVNKSKHSAIDLLSSLLLNHSRAKISSGGGLTPGVNKAIGMERATT